MQKVEKAASDCTSSSDPLQMKHLSPIVALCGDANPRAAAELSRSTPPTRNQEPP